MNFPMGLDKGFGAWLNEDMSPKALLQALGFSDRIGVKGFWDKKKQSRVSPLVRERQRFEEEVREQFKKLKEKGISIPVFTLWGWSAYVQIRLVAYVHAVECSLRRIGYH